ncbi:hypothetical protein QVD17_16897 [Tagetes erecta]|uniref:HAT C-terminal dimerisation domain-containing protein n=1 Tax=Tagetes erecta TaxID=13708 RepID=A0AAD8NTV1_TARER|nr:hypothetical protein QVD17_16897 [Tagetes erecta]
MKDPKKNVLNVVRESVAKNIRVPLRVASSVDIVERIILTTLSADDIDSFDILAWWKEREAEFPVLSAMAHDLLSSQVSTVAFESAFLYLWRSNIFKEDPTFSGSGGDVHLSQ